MKRLVVYLLLSALALRAEVEFSGFFLTAKQELFSLTNLEDQRSSGWLKTGQGFAGYTVVAFDREHETLTVTRDGKERKLPLRQSKIKDGRATISGTIKVMNEQIDGVRATLFFDEEAVFPLNNGIIFKLKPSRHTDGNIRYDAKFIAREKDGTERVLSAPSVIARPGNPFGIQIGDVGYSFTP